MNIEITQEQRQDILSKVRTHELIQELRNRGYVTSLLFDSEDVLMAKDRYCENNDVNFDITDNDYQYILENGINYDYITELVNNNLYDKVAEFYEDNN